MFTILEYMCQQLTEDWPYGSTEKLEKFDELKWALIQHYQQTFTPFLDLTQSTRVAASFALLDNREEYGYVYVFGLPNVNGSISYYVEEEIVLVKLQSALNDLR